MKSAPATRFSSGTCTVVCAWKPVAPFIKPSSCVRIVGLGVPVVVVDATRLTLPMLVPARRKFANDATVDEPHGSSTAMTS